MMALSARWHARRKRGGTSIRGGREEAGTGQKKDALLTQQVGHAAGCIRGGCGRDF